MKKMAVLFLIFSVLGFSACSPYSKKHKTYIKNHVIDLSQDFDNALNSYNTGFDKYEVYLIGEQHGIKETFEMDIAFTKYLYKTQNVRNILLEIGFSDGQLVNMYMETGNEDYLKNMFNNYSGTFAYSNDYFQMYRDFYTFNLTLEEDERVKFFGIDVQHQVHTGLYYINQLLSEKEIPDSIENAINNLKNCVTPNQDWWIISQQLKECIENNEADTKSYFGIEYNNLLFALEGIYQSVEYYNFSEKPETYREEMISQNFKALHKFWNENKTVGFFGGAHVSLKSENIDRISFAENINTTIEYLKEKVAAIYLTYPNGKLMNRKEGNPLKVYNDKLTKLLNKHVNYDLAFCRLDFEDSSFTHGYQYAVVIKNAHPATKYDTSKP